MARVIKNSVSDTTATTGTGALTLAGVVADAGTQTISAAHSTGDTVHYRIHNATQTEWEVGQGVFTSPSTLTRVTVEESSNADALVSFSAGAKTVYAAVTAADYDRMGNKTVVVTVDTTLTAAQSGYRFIVAANCTITLPTVGFDTGLSYEILTVQNTTATILVSVEAGIDTYLAFANNNQIYNNTSDPQLFSGGAAAITNGESARIVARNNVGVERKWHVEYVGVIKVGVHSHNPIVASALNAYQNKSGTGGRNVFGGYPSYEALSGYLIIIDSITGLETGYLYTEATGFWLWKMPDKSGTFAMLDDITAALLTGYTSGEGTILSSDSILQAIQKLNGNDELKANLSGAAFTGAVTIPAPSGATDAATKGYVDSVSAGLDVKPSAVCATTVNITLSGEQTLDSVTTAASRVLVKNQTAPAENGIYLSTSGAWARVADMDAWTEVPGSFVFVEQGTLYADTAWVCTANAGGTLGTTAVTWSQFAGPGAYTAGTGLSLAGSQFAIDSTVATLMGTQTLENKTFVAPILGAATGTSLAVTGGITSSDGKIGYTAGGAVTQLTSRSTGVTLNELCGNITMFSAAQAADAVVTFTLTNSFIAATDFVDIMHIGGGNGGAWNFTRTPAAGSCAIRMRNVTAASITEATALRFYVHKAATA